MRYMDITNSTRTDPATCCFSSSVFDTDGSGLIDADKIRHVMRNIGEEPTDEYVNKLIHDADIDKDGRINFRGMSQCYGIGIPFSNILCAPEILLS